MSRTDKDMPYWVAATWYEPGHRGCQHADCPWRGKSQRECDLPPRPTRQRPLLSSWRGLREQHCTWLPHWDNALHLRYGHGSRGVPGWFVRAHYHAPARTRSRDVLREAVKDWNGNGETGIEPEPRQGRSSARRDYW